MHVWGHDRPWIVVFYVHGSTASLVLDYDALLGSWSTAGGHHQGKLTDRATASSTKDVASNQSMPFKMVNGFRTAAG